MFPQRLKELRKSRRVSQRALAAALGVTQQAVGKWEMGRSTPDPATIARIADFFGASADYLLGCSGQRQRAAFSAGGEQYVSVPIIGTVKAGYDALAFEEDYGSAVADVHNPQEYFYLLVRGDSMEPQISDGDLALVRRQTDVESGQLAVVLIDGEEGTLKKVIKKDGAVILQPFNPAYPTQVFMGKDLENLQVVGKVVETKRRW
ncbi:MAG TPA: XRE family transcriptional regulator [Firmicutes bacterium]|nr:XRE family transcriptional regulator [Bacillota bacterium]